MLRDDQLKTIETNLRVARGAIERQRTRGYTPQGKEVNWADYAKELEGYLTRDQKMVEKLTRWTSDPTTWVGVFECQDFSSSHLGDRIPVPIDTSEWTKAKLGMRAPDGSYGPGWRWLLIGKCRTLSAALHILRHKDPKQVLNENGEDQSIPPAPPQPGGSEGQGSAPGGV